MCKNLSWKDRYAIALYEYLSIKDIMKLRNIGQPRAIEIRKKVIEYCLSHGLDNEIVNGVPTDIVLKVTGHDISYYFDKMKLEVEMQTLLK